MRGRRGGGALPEALARYDTLLEAEANYLLRLVDGAYRAAPDFDVFVPYSYLYFAAASYTEVAQ